MTPSSVCNGKPVINSELEECGRNYNGILQNIFLKGLRNTMTGSVLRVNTEYRTQYKMKTTNIYLSLPMPVTLTDEWRRALVVEYLSLWGTPLRGLRVGALYWVTWKTRFLRDVQKSCKRASLITGALIGEPGGVCLPGLLRVKDKYIWVH